MKDAFSLMYGAAPAAHKEASDKILMWMARLQGSVRDEPRDQIKDEMGHTGLLFPHKNPDLVKISSCDVLNIQPAGWEIQLWACGASSHFESYAAS